MFFKKSNIDSQIKTLVKQAAKWATTAQQDTSPYLSVMHSNYAMGYIMSLKDIARPVDIHRVTGIDFVTFEQHILNVQETVNNRLKEKVPEFAGDVNLYLSAIAEST
tara:strand:+ start:4310 stop:4630 length:321 start_codon:yes stop_codon:yes gene_type:complete